MIHQESTIFEIQQVGTPLKKKNIENQYNQIYEIISITHEHIAFFPYHVSLKKAQNICLSKFM